jgi:hypothetical protein
VFEVSRAFLPLEYLRVPHRLGGDAPEGIGVCRAGEHALYWAVEGERKAAERWLGDGWSLAADGALERDGDVFLPFDLGATMLRLWSERYATGSGRTGLKRLALRSYYTVRPVLPRAVQIWLRRRFAPVQARTRFPAWPLETSLHDQYALLLRRLAQVAGEPVPSLSVWPAGRSWALVLTHDVETDKGRDHVQLMRDLEAERGYRSSWNFVPKRYETPDSLVESLKADGFEVGVHGLYHDGRDLESRDLLERRLPEIRSYAERWGAVGFRSPATHRDWDLMRLLPFDYDSSSPDTDPFEPQSGGCCTWLPFENGGLVELPITLPQDHTLFVILRRDEGAWIEKADELRRRGGMALLITHPDYMIASERLAAYARFLDRYAGDESAWRALPSEVSAWWRRRAASSIERAGDGWRVSGPAAGEATVSLATP